MLTIVLGVVLALLALLVLGAIVFAAVWLLTALFHAVKPEELPGKNDANWSRDQGREAKGNRP